MSSNLREKINECVINKYAAVTINKMQRNEQKCEIKKKKQKQTHTKKN